MATLLGIALLIIILLVLFGSVNDISSGAAEREIHRIGQDARSNMDNVTTEYIKSINEKLKR
jgi:hypothetical protein